MRSRLGLVLLVAGAAVAVLAAGVVPVTAAPAASFEDVRFATFNASLNRGDRGVLKMELGAPGSAQPDVIAEIIQRTRPDVLLINEFDWDEDGAAAARFQDNYLAVGHNGAAPIVYPYRYVAASNTGVKSGFDLSGNGVVGTMMGTVAYADDALGFGFFPGQFSFVVYSMYPILHGDVRTFQDFLWKDMPGNLIPPGFYEPAELAILRLSSKNHVDVPIDIGGVVVHFLVSHPTPPVFDGPEDRNGRRNFDEIRFWADYVSGKPSQSGYIYDDTGVFGGLGHGDLFVIAGDLNSDPFDGDSIPGSAQLLVDHPKVNDTMTPSSEGAVQAAKEQANANRLHVGDPMFDTADFFDGFPPKPYGGAPGNLRADYVLPHRNIPIKDSAVFWPKSQDPLSALTGVFPFPSSDHRLVWIDARIMNA